MCISCNVPSEHVKAEHVFPRDVGEDAAGVGAVVGAEAAHEVRVQHIHPDRGSLMQDFRFNSER